MELCSTRTNWLAVYRRADPKRYKPWYVRDAGPYRLRDRHAIPVLTDSMDGWRSDGLSRTSVHRRVAAKSAEFVSNSDQYGRCNGDGIFRFRARRHSCHDRSAWSRFDTE